MKDTLSEEENTLKFFAYDEEGEGFVCFKSENKRDEFVKKAIQDYLENGWGSGVESITAGVITHTVKKANIQHRRDRIIDSDGFDGEGVWWDSDASYKCNYRLTPADGEDEENMKARDFDEQYYAACKYVILTRGASVSRIMRELKIGFNRAARIIEKMEENHVITAPKNNGERNVLAVQRSI